MVCYTQRRCEDNGKIIRNYRIFYTVIDGKYGNFLRGYVQYIGKLWKNTVEFDIETPNEAYIDDVPKYVQNQLVKIFKKEIWGNKNNS